jgi:hypothetical protein
MTARTPALFPAPGKPRAKPRRLLRYVDAGEVGFLLVCPRCGHDAGWCRITDAEYRRGVPCPACNVAEVSR